METGGDKWNEEYSVLEEKGDIGFIDYEDDSSVCSYNLIDEGPIVISAPFAFVNGKPQAVCVGDLATNSITIKNTTSDPVDLWGISIYASNPDNSFTLSLMEPPRSDSDIDAIQDFLESFSLDDRMLIPGEVLTIWLSCKPKDIGLHTTVVHFNFGGEKIERIAFLLVDDKISQSLTAKKPYSRGMKKKHVPVDSFVPGSRPAMNKERKFRNRLPRYDIPKEIRELLENRQIPNDVTEGLTRETYEKFFKTLLIMEEIQLEDDMRAYNMEGVFMKKRNYFLSLEVPGLAERRPSLVHGDFIFATLSSSANDQSSPYQGYVHHVEADEVHLKFDPDFHGDHRDNNFYNVHFTYNRINMRRLYQAVEAAQSLAPEFLFPSSERRQIKKTRFQPISCNLNEEQLSSIEMILGCKGAPPYLIHGPPGTGKTLTLVEAILQLYTTRQNARVLICAPSNSAADHILEILLNEKTIELRDSDIFRLNATTRPYEDVNPDHLRFCFLNERIFTSPPLRALLRYRIVISTYMSASLLYAEGMKRGHFSHLFLDESGQASEAETMIPIANLCQRTTVVVLAGDPKQLGPVIYSKEATAYGLGKSYLERLFSCEFYEYGDENYLTKLIRNYRCHPAILHLPSNLFYGGELLACKDAANSLSTEVDIVKLLPNKEFPVLFLGIQGCDEREGNNPSWFNRIEASKVVEIVKKLTATGNLGEESIGVITPYRQQVLKLKKTFENLDMLDIKIGSVEQFQGQEKQVIIVSTVRSTVKHNEFDRTYCLGFLSNPRRFNVAVTRAISLLVIIGNPHIINRDTYWNKLLWYCVDNSSYQGCPLPEREDHLIEATNEKKEERNHDGEGTVQNWINNGGNWNDNGGNWNDNGGDGGGKLSDDGGDGGGKLSDDGGDRNAKGGENCRGSNAVPEIPKPVTDEAEWSDGWNVDDSIGKVEDAELKGGDEELSEAAKTASR